MRRNSRGKAIVRYVALGMALAGMMAAGAARADVVFSDFGPGDSFQTDGAGITGASTFFGYFAAGGAFTPAQNYTVTGVDLAVSGFGSPGEASIWTDVGGVPGSQIGNAAGLTFPGPATIVPVTGLDATVLAGQRYFLVLTPGSDNADGTWFYNDGSYLTDVSNNGSGWTVNITDTQTPAFDIIGSPLTLPVGAPEPASIALLATGVAALGLKRRRAKSPGRSAA